LRNRQTRTVPQLEKGKYPIFRKEDRRMYLKKNRKIYLVMGFADMRKQINGLAQIAQEKKPKELL